MFRFKYDPLWKYVVIYDDDYQPIKTINYVDDFNLAKTLVFNYYLEYNQISSKKENNNDSN